MTQIGQTMQDLSKGYVPIIIVCAMIGAAVSTALWLQNSQIQVQSMEKKVTELQAQVTQLSTSVAQLTLTLAKGQPLPDNVAYKADLLRFCLKNQSLQCPDF